MEYVAGLVITGLFLIYVFEALRRSPPPKVQEDWKEITLAMKDMIPVEWLPIVSTIVESGKPVLAKVEKIGITEAKALLKAYAGQTDTPLDDAVCAWLEKENGA